MTQTTLNGEYLESFKVLKCFVCNAELGEYCLTDSFEGITVRCLHCVRMRKLK